ncbi:TVP38/TMEM64 family protein [Planctomycetota bacterium]
MEASTADLTTQATLVRDPEQRDAEEGVGLDVSPAPGSQPRRLRTVGVVAIVIMIGLAATTLPVRELLQGLLDFVQDMGPWGPPVLTAAYILACVLFLPGSVLTLAAGFLFGLGTGVVVVIAGSNVGAWASFLIGRTVGRGWIEEKTARNQRFRAIDQAVRNEGLKIVFLTRLSPVLPFNLLNFGFGATGVSFRDYALGSVVGMLPGTVMYVYLGSAAQSLARVLAGEVTGGLTLTLLKGFGLVATIVVTVLVTRMARKTLREVVEE